MLISLVIQISEYRKFAKEENVVFIRIVSYIVSIINLNACWLVNDLYL